MTIRTFLFIAVLVGPLACNTQQSNIANHSSKWTMDEIVPANSKMELLADGFTFLEGPIWDNTNERLIFSEVREHKLYEWSPKTGLSIFLDPYPAPRGNIFDSDGTILSCQGDTRQLVRIAADKSISIVADKFENKRLHSPNDVIIKRDGTIWFTDPDYGLQTVYGDSIEKYRELDKFHIFVLDPTTNVVKSAYDGLSKPNGLVFSKDETKLYVGNSGIGDRKLVVFDVDSTSNGLSNMKVLAPIESEAWGIDGLKMDEHENLYAACGDGINIFSPDGDLIGKIATDFIVTNVCFGGPTGKTLYITGREGLYRMVLNVAGK